MRWLRAVSSEHVLQAVKAEYCEEVKATFGTEIVVPKLPFPRVTMEKAYNIFDQMGLQESRFLPLFRQCINVMDKDLNHPSGIELAGWFFIF